MTTIRTRMAPSPTGKLHIGTAHTTLFNWLFTRHNHGTFILRIDDSDAARSKPEFEEDIISGIKWLGLNWDEGPFRQSENTAIYNKYVDQLMASGNAYKCYCSPEDLEKEREEQRASKQVPRYSGRCRSLTAQQKAELEERNIQPVIRFKVSDEKVTFTDMVRGEITVDMAQFGDFVIVRSDGSPLLNLAVVVDDIEMKITHVIRGEDFLNATPFQILIYQALKYPVPEIANLSFIYAPDHTKLSKRHGATGLSEYRQMGYLPEAVVNFLALLGWNPGDGDDREIFSLDQLVTEFDISRVQKSAPTFNLEKLNWFNEHYIRQKSDAELVELAKPFTQYAITPEIVSLIKERITTLSEIDALVKFFFVRPEVQSGLNKDYLQAAIETLNQGTDLAEMAKAKGWKVGDFFMHLRQAICGQKVTPPLTESMLILGKDEVLTRIKQNL